MGLRMFSRLRWLIFVFLFAGSTLGAAQETKKGKGETPEAPKAQAGAPLAKREAAPKAAPAPAAKPSLPDEFKLNMLIRTTIIAVNQANKTNNYTVLRDLGSPRFREANTADRLARIFESLRKAKFDLSPVLFFTPKLLRPPTIEDSGMLGLTGFFDTRPQRVAFDLLFEDVKGEWQLYGINIATQQAPAASGQGATPAGTAKPSESNGK